MGDVTGKVWGTTQKLVDGGDTQLHRIVFEAGGVCSEHIHERRHNAFYVLSGEMIVREWRGDRVTEHHLRTHDGLVVAPGVKHQFEGVKSGVALELYWGGPEEDIVRFTQGFVR